MSTQNTDFETIWIGIALSSQLEERIAAKRALRRIEASHAALLTVLEAILADEANRVLQTGPSQLINQAEAAIALAKGVAK